MIIIYVWFVCNHNILAKRYAEAKRILANGLSAKGAGRLIIVRYLTAISLLWFVNTIRKVFDRFGQPGEKHRLMHVEIS